MDKEIRMAQPHGFRAGVDRAIEIVERTLAELNALIYVRHEIVKWLRRQNVISQHCGA